MKWFIILAVCFLGSACIAIQVLKTAGYLLDKASADRLYSDELDDLLDCWRILCRLPSSNAGG